MVNTTISSSPSTESFAQLFEESLLKSAMASGELITATVVSIDSDYVTLDAGLKSESMVSISEFSDFYNAEGAMTLSVGDTVEVVLETPEDGFGETILSRERAKRM